MAFKVLVVANRTADSDDLLHALEARAQQSPSVFHLLVPCDPSAREAAQGNLDSALGHMREAGLTVEGSLGDNDPFFAVEEIWDPRNFDEVIVSTLPGATSKWIRSDLPHRIARATDVPVTHVISVERHVAAGGPPPEHEKPGVLSPLSVLSWGGRSSQRR
jgi:hypothetical protein